VGTRLRLARRDEILILALESDDGFPRLVRKILSELEAQITNLAAERDLRGAVITGTDRAFAAGAEIAEIARLTPVAAFEFARYGQSVMRAIANSPKPVIAAIHG
jgi:enoyl-CoA hydratase